MRDLQDILAAAQKLVAPATLATVVRVEGSSYRLPGARLLIDASGQRVGSVSGGCLEADIARRGRLLSPQSPAQLVHYDSADDEFNLGCNGSIDILLQRVTPDDPSLNFLRSCVTDRHPGVLITVFAAPPGAGLCVGDQAALTGNRIAFSTLADHPLAAGLMADARDHLHAGHAITSTRQTAAGDLHVLMESIQPPLALLICGAGHDTAPLVQMAKSLGWQVTVHDRRPGYARPDHFPSADRVLSGPISALPNSLPLTHNTAAVIKTHHYPDDLALLRMLLPSACQYIGLLGPQTRAQRLLANLQSDDFTVSPAQLARLHAPIGLDLGAEGPHQVAVAIVAEILAVTNHRWGGPLRSRQIPIHGPVMERVTSMLIAGCSVTN